MSHKNKKSISLYIFITGVIIFFLTFVFFVVFFIYNNNDNYKADKELLSAEVQKLADGEKVPYGDPLIFDEQSRYPKVAVDDPVKGNVQALVTIFLFSDFTCESCLKQQQIVNTVMNDYSAEQVRLVWKGVATDAEGILAQSAAYCAHAQGLFWDFAKELFSLSQGKFNIKEYQEIAKKLGLNEPEYIQCLNESQMTDKIYTNNNLASDLGIEYLPYFYVDNTPYRGVLSVRQLKGIISLLLDN